MSKRNRRAANPEIKTRISQKTLPTNVAEKQEKPAEKISEAVAQQPTAEIVTAAKTLESPGVQVATTEVLERAPAPEVPQTEVVTTTGEAVMVETQADKACVLAHEAAGKTADLKTRVANSEHVTKEELLEGKAACLFAATFEGQTREFAESLVVMADELQALSEAARLQELKEKVTCISTHYGQLKCEFEVRGNVPRGALVQTKATLLAVAAEVEDKETAERLLAMADEAQGMVTKFDQITLAYSAPSLTFGAKTVEQHNEAVKAMEAVIATSVAMDERETTAVKALIQYHQDCAIALGQNRPCPLRPDGPTLEEWVKSGRDRTEANYPPPGYADKRPKPPVSRVVGLGLFQNHDPATAGIGNKR